MARITHPNLALVYGVETWRGTPLVIFEYLAGGTLADRLGGGPLSTPEVLELGLVLADVAHTIHDSGILHRDIKPSNIGFDSRGVPKLLDFGLARMVEVTSREALQPSPAPGVPPCAFGGVIPFVGRRAGWHAPVHEPGGARGGRA